MGDFGLLKPICLFEQFFDHKLRLNDAPYDKFADFTCATSVIRTAVGSAMVSVGDTKVICGVKVKVLPCEPDESISHLICNVEYLGLAYRGQRINQGPSKELQAISVQLEWLLSNIVIPDASKQLQIYSEGDKKIPTAVYILHVDVGILLDNGCLLDTCLASAVAALETAAWPRLISVPLPHDVAKSAPTPLKIEFEEKEPSEMIKLAISERPVALSFAVVPQSPPETTHVLISQPSKIEFQLWDTDASPCYIVLDSQKRIVDFSITGGAFCSPLWQHIKVDGGNNSKENGIIQQIFDRASEQANAIRQKIMNANKEFMSVKLYSVVRGKLKYPFFFPKIVSIKEYGAFVSLENTDRQGLLHCSAISNHTVENVSDVLEVGETVFVKIISEKDGKLGLSMKVVNQTTGEDRDPNNLIIAQMERRKQGPMRAQSPIRLGAELNTVCKQCGVKGHLASTCFAQTGMDPLGLISSGSDVDEAGGKAEGSLPKKEKKSKKLKSEKKKKEKHSKYHHRHRFSEDKERHGHVRSRSPLKESEKGRKKSKNHHHHTERDFVE
ncbi:unnamed protein product [Rodentolepis nana]|uniref:S1 motif domain-containing protein n=1 Tax=Rodentolepis nana TaxID=102285 RepID=A0A0R3TN27_RODNA|nr:unnamed protein product [Rodentolepis nana]